MMSFVPWLSLEVLVPCFVDFSFMALYISLTILGQEQGELTNHGLGSINRDFVAGNNT